MLSTDPVVIESEDDLKEIAAQMKQVANPDDDPSSYSQTKKEAKISNVLGKLTPEQIEEIKKSGGNRAIIFDMKIYSLVMTVDEHHNHDWHLSMCQVFGPNLIDHPNKDYAETICNAFFAVWKPVENPGKMKTLHFVGNDEL